MSTASMIRGFPIIPIKIIAQFKIAYIIRIILVINK